MLRNAFAMLLLTSLTALGGHSVAAQRPGPWQLGTLAREVTTALQQLPAASGCSRPQRCMAWR